MQKAGGGFQERGRETHEGGDARGTQLARSEPRCSKEVQSTPRRTLAAYAVRVKKQKQNESSSPRANERSGTAALRARWNESIREKIIGHRMAVGAGGFRIGSGRGSHAENGAFALLHQPAREHGRSVLLEPLVQQFGDFLAEIGRVGEAGELVGLQRVAGSGEKKLPGSLGAGLGHDDLRRLGFKEYDKNISSMVITVTSNHRITGLWKTVEKKENSARCCSGCAGDYEDPDRSAWEPDREEEQGDAEDRDGSHGNDREEGRETTMFRNGTGNSNRRRRGNVAQGVTEEEQ